MTARSAVLGFLDRLLDALSFYRRRSTSTAPDLTKVSPGGKSNMARRTLALAANPNHVVFAVDLTKGSPTARDWLADWQPIGVTDPQDLATPADIVTRERAAAVQRVAAGAALLDEVCPTWATRFDPIRLDVSDSFGCPLAQLYPLIDVPPEAITTATRWAGGAPTPFTIAVAALADAPASAEGWACRHGFGSDWDDEREVQVTCGALTTAWRAAIQRRRTAVTA
jgi:hypothetical protein